MALRHFQLLLGLCVALWHHGAASPTLKAVPDVRAVRAASSLGTSTIFSSSSPPLAAESAKRADSIFFASSPINGTSATEVTSTAARNAEEVRSLATAISDNDLTKEATTNAEAVHALVRATISKQKPSLKSDSLPLSKEETAKALRVSVVFFKVPCGKRKCCRLHALGGACSCLKVGAKCYNFLLPPVQPDDFAILPAPSTSIPFPCPRCYRTCIDASGHRQCCRLEFC